MITYIRIICDRYSSGIVESNSGGNHSAANKKVAIESLRLLALVKSKLKLFVLFDFPSWAVFT